MGILATAPKFYPSKAKKENVSAPPEAVNHGNKTFVSLHALSG
jgi:hypothetical protein